MGLYPNNSKKLNGKDVKIPIRVENIINEIQTEIIPIHSNYNKDLLALRPYLGGCKKAR